jgi:hypothetical protein
MLQSRIEVTSTCSSKRCTGLQAGGYLVHCEGGAANKYAKSCCGGGTTGGTEIDPPDEKAALDWCEERGIDGETVVKKFGHLLETSLRSAAASETNPL